MLWVVPPHDFALMRGILKRMRVVFSCEGYVLLLVLPDAGKVEKHE